MSSYLQMQRITEEDPLHMSAELLGIKMCANK